MASTPTKHVTPTPPSTAQEIAQLRYAPRRATSINVGHAERLFSLLGGGLLILYGLGRKRLSGIALALLGGDLLRRGLTGHCYLYQALDISTFEESPHTVARLPHNMGIKVQRAMTIQRSPEELYRFWHNVENAPLYMQYIQRIQVTGDRTSHWIATTPTGTPLEWDSEITQDVPNKLIAWQAIGKALTGTGGQITFTPAPANKGTVVTVEMDFSQPGGALGASFAPLLGHLPEQLVRENLRRFKELMETGEIATIHGQPVGRGQIRSQQGRKIQES